MWGGGQPKIAGGKLYFYLIRETREKGDVGAQKLSKIG